MTDQEAGVAGGASNEVSQVLEDLDELARLSAPGDGVTRLAYSKEDDAARRWFAERARRLNLDCQVDSFGNSFAWTRSQESTPCLLFGSHLDSVVDGGRFDGALGVAAAFEIVSRLQRLRPHTRLGVAAFACEESVRFGIGGVGSRALVGDLSSVQLDELVDQGGTQLRSLRERSGLLQRGAVTLPPIRAYVEIHVDQNGGVATSGAAVGLVPGIAGVARTALTWRGQASHSGAHGRSDRRDALLAAAAFLTGLDAFWSAAEAEGHALAITVGKLNCYPNQPNTVVGRVEAVLDVRALDPQVLEAMSSRLSNMAKKLAAECGLELDVQSLGVIAPVPMDQELLRAFDDSAARLGLPTVTTPSMSGHDAGILAPHMPAAMIFVANPAGVSHSPEEAIDEKSLEAAIAVAVDAVGQLGDRV